MIHRRVSLTTPRPALLWWLPILPAPPPPRHADALRPTHFLGMLALGLPIPLHFDIEPTITPARTEDGISVRAGPGALPGGRARTQAAASAVAANFA